MQINYKLVVGLLATSFLTYSCNDNANKDTNMDKTTEHHGIDVHYMDTTVNPREDFFNFVNGTWMKETEIPDDQKSWGSFYILRKNVDLTVLELLNNAIKDNHFAKGSDEAKAILLFKSKLDTNFRNEQGLAPIRPIMEEISMVQNVSDLQTLLSTRIGRVSNPFFSLYASALPENSAINGAYIYPGGLGLPDRDYYTKTDEKSVQTREDYKAFITRMLVYAFEDSQEDAKAKAERILSLETKLAKPRLTKEERRDARAQNNPRSVEQISKMTPAVDWKRWIEELPVAKSIDTLIVTQLKYMEALQTILVKEDIEDIKLLIQWQTLNNAAGKLTTELEEMNFDFYGRTLEGTPQQRPADERALLTVNSSIGEALGKIYVETYFPAEAKQVAQEMVDNVIATYAERIKNLDWMSAETKEKALEKLSTFVVKIGYPDVWKDYSEMDIKEGNSFYENMVASSEWHYKENVRKIDEPVDKNEWFMSPQTVNAYYNPQANEIVFPAAILQPPFFDYKADAAVNYGGIGAVIGHEITHGFDDEGSRFDADGNLKDWWTEGDRTKFEERTKQLADFYSAIEVEDGLFLNGEFTLGENTADLGGVLSAYYGLQRHYQNHEKPEKIDGFTQEQRFFISWATVWRTKTRPEALRTQIMTDPHAPGYYRAFLPLQNVDAFYDAFGIQEGDKLYIAPENRVRIW